MSLECMVRFARNKNNMIKSVDLFHVSPWPLTLRVTLAMNFQGQILKLLYDNEKKSFYCHEDT